MHSWTTVTVKSTILIKLPLKCSGKTFNICRIQKCDLHYLSNSARCDSHQSIRNRLTSPLAYKHFKHNINHIHCNWFPIPPWRCWFECTPTEQFYELFCIIIGLNYYNKLFCEMTGLSCYYTFLCIMIGFGYYYKLFCIITGPSCYMNCSA
jgi:hypothetical protein